MTDMPDGFLKYILENHIRLDIDDIKLKNTYPYIVKGVDLKENNIIDVTKWCKENITDHDYCMVNYNHNFYFKFALDAVAFKLTWV